MRLIPFLLLVLLFDIYAFQAFQHISQAWHPESRFLLYSVYWFLPLLALLLLVGLPYFQANSRRRNLFITLRAILMIAYLCKLLMVVVLLMDDARRLVVLLFAQFDKSFTSNIGRSGLMSSIAVSAGILPFFLLLYGMLRNRHRYRLFHEKIWISDLPTALKGLRIVHISDIHCGSFTSPDPVRRAVQMINRENADLVFFTGDLVNNKASEMLGFIDIFDKIESKYGVFSILGNHDYGDYVAWPNLKEKEKNLAMLKDVHRQLGWKLLLNAHQLLKIREEEVAIIGVENWSASRRFPKYGRLEDAYVGCEQAGLKLLLSHDPSHWEAEVLKEYPGIAITFSGHTHGMQFGIEIRGWIKWSPARYIYKQWAGLYRQGQQYLYVNRGLGYLGYPGRVGILPEITVIDLE